MSQKIQSVERRANTIVNLLGLDVPLWTEEREHVVGSISVSSLSTSLVTMKNLFSMRGKRELVIGEDLMKDRLIEESSVRIV